MLSDETPQRLESAIVRLEAAQQRQTRVLLLITLVLALLAIGYFLR